MTASIKYAHLALILSLLVMVATAGGCKTADSGKGSKTTPAAKPAAPARPKVAKVPPEAKVDMSGYWNDNDAEAAVKALMAKLLACGAVADTTGKRSRKAVLRQYPIRNRSSEHINTARLKNQFRMALMKSGKVRLVASLGDPGPGKAGKLAADYILGGWFTSASENAGEGKRVNAYTLTLELTDATSNEIVWTDQHKVKKILELPKGAKKVW